MTDALDPAVRIREIEAGESQHPIESNVENLEDYPVVEVTVQLRGEKGYTAINAVAEQGTDPQEFAIELSQLIADSLYERTDIVASGLARNGVFVTTSSDE